ncbi:hypothetical protein [Caballeronia sp. ATUFL_M2_KS44]|uniref:hypothetical protein n=1 Tax=Caballeronia sp. ATUFL_M2_KS44 TaxID=2921767 RepID=UPI00202846B4|nr:hypothetical protein [Caballeronia sp. ATUFL_M2_KS44]
MATTEDVIAVFEQINFEGKDLLRLEDACLGFAKWLAIAWDDLDDEDREILMTVGATVWRESKRGSGKKDWRSAA